MQPIVVCDSRVRVSQGDLTCDRPVGHGGVHQSSSRTDVTWSSSWDGVTDETFEAPILIRVFTVAEKVAAAFHESYERQAPEHGYRTREASAKPWGDVPDDNRRLMVAVVQELIDRGVIKAKG